jgi:hypothetical protein
LLPKLRRPTNPADDSRPTSTRKIFRKQAWDGPTCPAASRHVRLLSRAATAAREISIALAPPPAGFLFACKVEKGSSEGWIVLIGASFRQVRGDVSAGGRLSRVFVCNPNQVIKVLKPAARQQWGRSFQSAAQSRRRIISHPRSLGGTSYSSIARAISVCLPDYMHQARTSSASAMMLPVV